jgi:hypothetical protein
MFTEEFAERIAAAAEETGDEQLAHDVKLLAELYQRQMDEDDSATWHNAALMLLWEEEAPVLLTAVSENVRSGDSAIRAMMGVMDRVAETFFKLGAMAQERGGVKRCNCDEVTASIVDLNLN